MKIVTRLNVGVLALCAGVLGFQHQPSLSGFLAQKPPLALGNLGLHLMFRSMDSPVGRIESKVHFIQQLAPAWDRRKWIKTPHRGG
jgi:hypothetical protein